MSLALVLGVVDNPAIDSLIQSSLESKNKYLRLELEWIPCSQITDIKPTQIDNATTLVIMALTR